MNDLKKNIEIWLSDDKGIGLNERQRRSEFLEDITYLDYKGDYCIHKPRMRPQRVKKSLLNEMLKDEKLIRVSYHTGSETMMLRLLNNMGFSVYQYAWKGERDHDMTMLFMTR